MVHALTSVQTNTTAPRPPSALSVMTAVPRAVVEAPLTVPHAPPEHGFLVGRADSTAAPLFFQVIPVAHVSRAHQAVAAAMAQHRGIASAAPHGRLRYTMARALRRVRRERLAPSTAAARFAPPIVPLAAAEPQTSAPNAPVGYRILSAVSAPANQATEPR